ncbi:MAG: hypothetical protein LBC93_03075, partial [Synergistaceae bacterium]|nr:hypothetical protein [Synergistaceae bacterium]
SLLSYGLNLSTDGVIFGTPTASGTADFIVKAASGTVSATKNLSITIDPAGGGLSITTTSLSNGTVGMPYSETLTAVGGSGAVIWMLDSGNLPSGLILLENGTISGTPARRGTADFTVKAASGTVSATKALSITIDPAGGGLIITTTSLPRGIVGTSYNATLTATGGSGAVIWTLDSGNLPSGLILLENGTISGTPAMIGTANFTVKAASGTVSATKNLSITIDPAGGGLIITTTTLRKGAVGTPYSETLAATGGSGSITWTLDSGNLPSGLILLENGTISGTPTASGTANFTVKAARGTEIATKALSITIDPAGGGGGDSGGGGCNSGFFSAASALLALFSLLVVQKKQ